MHDLLARGTQERAGVVEEVGKYRGNIGAGDRVEFLINPAGEVRLQKAVFADAELQALEATLSPEWDSASDDTAFAGL